MNSLNPRKPYLHLLAGAAVALTLAACGGGSDGDDNNPDPQVVEVDDPNGLMDALENKVTSGGSSLQFVNNGTTPPASTADTDPEPLKAEAVEEVTAVPGDTVTLPVSLNGSPQLDSLFAKVPGASSYFQAQVAPGGKARVAGKASLITLTTIDFQVTVPDNVQADAGSFCFDFTVKSADGRVSDPVRSCIDVKSTPPPQPTNDQPTVADLDAALAGNWFTNCIDIEDEDFDGDGTTDFSSAKLGLTFGSGRSYAESVVIYSDNNCATPAEGFEGAQAFINGTYNAGGSQYSEQGGFWQRNFTFTPTNDPNFPELQFDPCFNRLRLNANKTQLFLGVPITFTFDDGSNPVEGDCRSDDTRPETVLTALPFIKQ